MRKHKFTTYLSVAALLGALALQSCQSKPANQQADCSPTTSQPCNEGRDEGQMNRERDYEEEEANEEAMIHVIEIEQPAPASVSEEKAPAAPAVEIPAEAPMEAHVAPVTDTPAAPVAESATSVTPAAESMAAAAPVESSEAVIAAPKE